MRYFLFSLLLFLANEIVQSQTVDPHPDNSVTTAEFIKMGIPNVDTIWGVESYETAFKILDKIFEMDKYSIPRYKSLSSAQLFDRLVAFENYDYLLDESVPINLRLQALSNYAYFPAKLQYIYTEANAKTERFGAELVESMLLNVYLSSNAFILVRNFEKAIGDRVNKVEIDKAKKQIQKGTIVGIKALLKIFNEDNKRFDRLVVERLANRMIHFFPSIWLQIEVNQRESFKAEIKQLSKTHSNKTVKKAMKSLSKKLKKR